jgi:hypothetical protein
VFYYFYELYVGNQNLYDLISFMINYIYLTMTIHTTQFYMGYIWTLCYNPYQLLFESVRSKLSKIHLCIIEGLNVSFPLYFLLLT